MVFEPKLPERKQTAIERLGFGAENKILLRFATSFWDPHPYVQRY